MDNSPPVRRRARSMSFHSVEDHPGELPQAYVIQELARGLGIIMNDQLEPPKTRKLPAPPSRSEPTTPRRTSSTLAEFGVEQREFPAPATPLTPRVKSSSSVMGSTGSASHFEDNNENDNKSNENDSKSEVDENCCDGTLDPTVYKSPPTPPSAPFDWKAPKLRKFHPDRIGVLKADNTEPKESEQGDLSELFWKNFRRLERNTNFTKIQSKCFGTWIDIKGEWDEDLRVNLIFDMFTLKDGVNFRSHEEITLRVNAMLEGRQPIGHLTACTASAAPIVERDEKNDEPIYNTKHATLTIKFLEVAREFQRRHIGKKMVDLVLGQAMAHRMLGAQCWPFSFRYDGKLMDGGDKAKKFWQEMGFQHTVTTGKYEPPFWKSLRDDCDE